MNPAMVSGGLPSKRRASGGLPPNDPDQSQVNRVLDDLDGLEDAEIMPIITKLLSRITLRKASVADAADSEEDAPARPLPAVPCKASLQVAKSSVKSDARKSTSTASPDSVPNAHENSLPREKNGRSSVNSDPETRECTSSESNDKEELLDLVSELLDRTLSRRGSQRRNQMKPPSALVRKQSRDDVELKTWREQATTTSPDGGVIPDMLLPPIHVDPANLDYMETTALIDQTTLDKSFDVFGSCEPSTGETGGQKPPPPPPRNLALGRTSTSSSSSVPRGEKNKALRKTFLPQHASPGPTPDFSLKQHPLVGNPRAQREGVVPLDVQPSTGSLRDVQQQNHNPAQRSEFLPSPMIPWMNPYHQLASAGSPQTNAATPPFGANRVTPQPRGPYLRNRHASQTETSSETVTILDAAQQLLESEKSLGTVTTQAAHHLPGPRGFETDPVPTATPQPVWANAPQNQTMYTQPQPTTQPGRGDAIQEQSPYVGSGQPVNYTATFATRPPYNDTRPQFEQYSHAYQQQIPLSYQQAPRLPPSQPQTYPRPPQPLSCQPVVSIPSISQPSQAIPAPSMAQNFGHQVPHGGRVQLLPQGASEAPSVGFENRSSPHQHNPVHHQAHYGYGVNPSTSAGNEPGARDPLNPQSGGVRLSLQQQGQYSNQYPAHFQKQLTRPASFQQGNSSLDVHSMRQSHGPDSLVDLSTSHPLQPWQRASQQPINPYHAGHSQFQTGDSEPDDSLRSTIQVSSTNPSPLSHGDSSGGKSFVSGYSTPPAYCLPTAAEIRNMAQQRPVSSLNFALANSSNKRNMGYPPLQNNGSPSSPNDVTGNGNTTIEVKGVQQMRTQTTISKYRENAKKSKDPKAQVEFAKWVLREALKLSENDATREPLIKEGIEIIRKLADEHSVKLGHPDAQFFLAECYRKGALGFKQSMSKAFDLYSQASKRNHYAAKYQRALCYELGQGTKPNAMKALELYRQAASGGITAAMCKLALIHEKGLLKRKPNTREYLLWYKRAAADASPSNPYALFALFRLGCHYEASQVLHDRDYAFEMFLEASQLGHTPSMWKLGKCYENGLGTQMDSVEAARWLEMAKANGMNEYEVQNTPIPV